MSYPNYEDTLPLYIYIYKMTICKAYLLGFFLGSHGTLFEFA